VIRKQAPHPFRSARSIKIEVSQIEVWLLLMFLYSVAWVAALVVSAPWWLWKMAAASKYREGLTERLGRVPARLVSADNSRPVIWIHAVSVGEVIAISGLVRELRSEAAHPRVVVSTTTRTGQHVARERFGPENVFYYPLDFASAVLPYLRSLRPRVFVLTETEFWPRMLHECHRAGIPIAVVNARISDRSYPRYLRLRPLWSRILRNLTTVLAQSREDAARLRAIGVPAGRVILGGNLKYDVRAGAASPFVESLRTALPGNARVLICGSTLEGEEQLLNEAWPGLIAAQPELRMVLAPRHPERFASVAALLDRSGIRWSRRSEWDASGPDTSGDSRLAAGSVLLLDSIGELASVYSLAAVAFVGGSLVAGGGHNPLEPAQFGVPIMMGPNYDNFREIVNKLRAQQAIRIVDGPELGPGLLRLLTDNIAAQTMGERARAVFDAEAGATSRAVKAILALLQGEAA
jgi:3-deoxy-D-manno-octulosonic-acid transferase